VSSLNRLGRGVSTLSQRVVFACLTGVSLLNFSLLIYLEGRVPWGWFLGASATHENLKELGALTSGLAQTAPWLAVSALFVHGSLVHLLVNLYVLFHVGRLFNGRFGAPVQAVFFIVTGILGNEVSSVWYGQGAPVVGGLSVGSFGLAGALVSEFSLSRLTRHRDLVFQTALSLFVLSALSPINNFAHLVAAGVGFLLAVVFRKSLLSKDKLGRGKMVGAGFALAVLVLSIALAAAF